MVCRDLNPNHDVNFQHYMTVDIMTVETQIMVFSSLLVWYTQTHFTYKLNFQA